MGFRGLKMGAAPPERGRKTGRRRPFERRTGDRWKVRVAVQGFVNSAELRERRPWSHYAREP